MNTGQCHTRSDYTEPPPVCRQLGKAIKHNSNTGKGFAGGPAQGQQTLEQLQASIDRQTKENNALNDQNKQLNNEITHLPNLRHESPAIHAWDCLPFIKLT
jgi:hypothetical protein